MNQIKVLVVDDSSFLRRNIPLLLETDPNIKVIGTASNGQEAVEMTRELRPDVITMDVVMPVMDGITALKNIMKETPTPVVMVSCVTKGEAELSMEALSIGAIDYVLKPSGSVSLDIATVRKELVEKINLAYNSNIKSIVDVSTSGKIYRTVISEMTTINDSVRMESLMPAKHQQPKAQNNQKELLAIGASTGGPVALQVVLKDLPADISVGVVIVQHITKGFSDALAKRLNTISPITIKESTEFERILPGVGLVAPAGMHMTVKRVDGKLYSSLSEEPVDTLHKPSVDILFHSVAKTCGDKACAVILTGMGADGADGITSVSKAGGMTIAQDEASSVIFGMPKEAIARGGIDRVVSLDKIAVEINSAIQ